MFGLTGRAVRRLVHAAAITAASLVLLVTSNVAAEAETRTLKFYHVHLRERSEVTYKRNGRFLAEGLKQANWALRDWRESKPTQMDPMLLDILWEVYRRSGSRDYINVIGGYRSPNTNRTLRSRSNGVAETSLHMSGKAIDFFIPDVPLSRVRALALQVQTGGVGYYPRSGSPFVHVDTGKGRYWPRMNRNELAKIFPNGNTIYVPADGKPLPGYDTALASYNQRRSSGSVQMADVRRSGPTLLARLFGGGAEEAEDNAEAAAAPTPAPRRAAPQVQVAAAQPTRPAALPAGVAMPDRETFDVASRSPTPRAGIPEQQIASLARVPVPTRAPNRNPAPTPEGQIPAAAEPTLVAALEAEAPNAAAPAQLAYAVPMPSRRPPFEAVLQPESAIPVPMSTPQAETAVAAVTPTPAQAEEAPSSVASTAIAPSTVAPSSIADVLVAAAEQQTPPESLAIPVANPALEAAPALAPVDAHSTLVAALEAEAVILPAAAAETTTPSGGPVTSGKSGRVLREPAGRASATPVAIEEAIASRIEIAALVTSPERRAQEARTAHPKADMLVVDVPVSVLATGFAPKQPLASSDRFSGSAVTFLPVRKLN